jgi:hypothetical protein
VGGFPAAPHSHVTKLSLYLLFQLVIGIVHWLDFYRIRLGIVNFWLLPWDYSEDMRSRIEKAQKGIVKAFGSMHNEQSMTNLVKIVEPKRAKKGPLK